MSLRRILLAGMLVALGACALLGMAAVAVKGGDSIFGLLLCAIAVAVGFGVMLPLTFLAEKPRFRAAGLGGIVVVGMLMTETVLLTVVSMAGSWWRMSSAVAGMLGMTLLAGLPVTFGLLLARFKPTRWAAWGMAGVGGVTLLLSAGGAVMTAAEVDGRLSENLWGMAMVTLGMGFVLSLLLVNVGCGDRRYFRWPAIAMAVIAWLACFMAMLWHEGMRAMAIVLAGLVIVPAYLGHLNVLLMARLRPLQGWLLLLTALASAGCGVAIFVGIAAEEEVMMGMSVAAGITAMCGTMALLVLSFFNRKINELPAVETLLKEIQVVCPRCGRGQVMGTGGAACGGCGLELHIRIVEPRCGKCGYLIYGVGVKKCPECGEIVEGVLGEVGTGIPPGEAGGMPGLAAVPPDGAEEGGAAPPVIGASGVSTPG